MQTIIVTKIIPVHFMDAIEEDSKRAEKASFVYVYKAEVTYNI